MFTRGSFVWLSPVSTVAVPVIITGYFYGIIHSINGVFLVLMTGITCAITVVILGEALRTAAPGLTSALAVPTWRDNEIYSSTLWWTNIAMENHHFSWENPLFLFTKGYHDQWEISRILEWRYCTIVGAIFWGYIPWNLGLIYGR